MAYGSRFAGGYGADATVIHFDSSDSYIYVPDAELLFRGEFQREGSDLILVGRDGHHEIIPGYFASAHPQALMAPNGGRLTADLVDLLAGPRAPGEYAQAQPTPPADAIGKVEKIIGNVTVIRNGVSVGLNVGDAVYKSDVVQTGANSSVGIGFPDGTALNLVANTRMALNDYVYDANSTSNVALFSLVEGTFAFVAGRVAHTGDMKIATPVATMGIRGTTGIAEQVATVNANTGEVAFQFAVFNDPGVNTHGAWSLTDDSGNQIGMVADPGVWVIVRKIGTSGALQLATAAISDLQLPLAQSIVNGAIQTQSLISTQQQQTAPSPGSSTPPAGLNEQQLPQLIQNIQPPNTNNFAAQTFQSAPSAVSNTVTIPTVVNQSPPPTTDVWASTSSGQWQTGSNWSNGSEPTPTQTVEITTPVSVILNTAATVDGLTLVAGAVLEIVSGGSLTILGGTTSTNANGTTSTDTLVIKNAGTVELNSSAGDPNITISGTTQWTGGGTVPLNGATGNQILGTPNTNATLDNVDNTIVGSGLIGAGDGALTLINETAGSILASGGPLIIDTGNPVTNAGTMGTMPGGSLAILDPLDNSGSVTANGGIVAFQGSTVTNTGAMAATNDGEIVLSQSTLTNSGAGQMTVDATSSFVVFDSKVVGGTITDNGLVDVTGTSTFQNISLAGGSFTIESGVTATLDDVTATNTAITIYGTINIDGSQTLTLAGSDSVASNNNVAINNNGSLVVEGTVDFAPDITLNGSGHVAITGGGIADFAGGLNQNVDFTGSGTVELAQAFNDTVLGFARGDIVDTATVAYAPIEGALWQQNGAGGALTISNGAQTETLAFAGTYAQDDFALASDGKGGTDIVFSPTQMTIGGLNAQGNAVAGQAATVSLSANDLGTVSYTWLANGQVIAGATGASYTPTAAQAGDALDVLTSFTDPTTNAVEHLTGLAGTVQSGGPGQGPIVYMTDTTDPWGVQNVVGSPEYAMNQAFGTGNWTADYGYTTAAFTPSTHFIYIDGGDGDSADFNAFLNANLSLIENWVANGGHLFINAAQWTGGNIDLGNDLHEQNVGFGAYLEFSDNYTVASDSGQAVNPSNPIFATSGTSWTGDYFSHDIVTGSGFESLITGTSGTVLAEENYGSGNVVIGGMTFPYFQSPSPQAENLFAGILLYASGLPTEDMASPITVGAGATVDISTPSNATVTFASSSGTVAFAEATTFSGQIAGISGPGDVLDLSGFDLATTTATPGTYANGITTLTVADDDHGVTFALDGNYSNATFTVTSDDEGGVDVADPPSTATTPSSNTGTTNVAALAAETGAGGSNNAPDPSLNWSQAGSHGGLGTDSFVFRPQVNAGTLGNGGAPHDPIVFDQHVANVQMAQQLAAEITPETHGAAITGWAEHTGMDTHGANTQWAMLQSASHLH